MKPFSSSYSTSTDALEKVRGEAGSSSRRDEGNMQEYNLIQCLTDQF